jgi:hypothetical protein
MEQQFIIALANRSKTEADLLDKLPEDVRVLVQAKLDESNGTATE